VRIEKKGVRTQTSAKVCYQGFGQSLGSQRSALMDISRQHFNIFTNTLSSMDIEVTRTVILVGLPFRAIAALKLKHGNSDQLVVPYNPL